MNLFLFKHKFYKKNILKKNKQLMILERIILSIYPIFNYNTCNSIKFTDILCSHN